MKTATPQATLDFAPFDGVGRELGERSARVVAHAARDAIDSFEFDNMVDAGLIDESGNPTEKGRSIGSGAGAGKSPVYQDVRGLWRCTTCHERMFFNLDALVDCPELIRCPACTARAETVSVRSPQVIAEEFQGAHFRADGDAWLCNRCDGPAHAVVDSYVGHVLHCDACDGKPTATTGVAPDQSEPSKRKRGRPEVDPEHASKRTLQRRAQAERLQAEQPAPLSPAPPDDPLRLVDPADGTRWTGAQWPGLTDGPGPHVVTCPREGCGAVADRSMKAWARIRGEGRCENCAQRDEVRKP